MTLRLSDQSFIADVVSLLAAAICCPLVCLTTNDLFIGDQGSLGTDGHTEGQADGGKEKKGRTKRRRRVEKNYGRGLVKETSGQILRQTC